MHATRVTTPPEPPEPVVEIVLTMTPEEASDLYAYLGGISGPMHSAMVRVLTPSDSWADRFGDWQAVSERLHGPVYSALAHAGVNR